MTIDCPHESCDYTAPTKKALMAHANASGDHDWSEIKDAIENSDEQDPESNESKPEASDGDRNEAADNQASESNESKQDEPETPEEPEDMPTDKEIERQRQQATTGRNSDGKSDNSSQTASQNGPIIPVPTSTLLLVGGVALGGLVLYLYLTTDRQPDHRPDEEQEKQVPNTSSGLIPEGQL